MAQRARAAGRHGPSRDRRDDGRHPGPGRGLGGAELRAGRGRSRRTTVRWCSCDSTRQGTVERRAGRPRRSPTSSPCATARSCGCRPSSTATSALRAAGVVDPARERRPRAVANSVLSPIVSASPSAPRVEHAHLVERQIGALALGDRAPGRSIASTVVETRAGRAFAGRPRWVHARFANEREVR